MNPLEKGSEIRRIWKGNNLNRPTGYEIKYKNFKRLPDFRQGTGMEVK